MCCVEVIHLRICDLIVAVVVAVVVPLRAHGVAIVVACGGGTTPGSVVESACLGTIVGRRSTTSFRH